MSGANMGTTPSTAGGEVTTGDHTPGPWFVHDFTSLRNDGQHDVVVSCSTPDHIGVAIMDRALTATHEEALANARKISAVPEMYRALKQLAQYYGWASYDGLGPTGRMVLDAIAKAEGRQQ